MNLFILEDDSRQAAGLKQYLKDYQENFEIFHADSYEDAKKLVTKTHMDLFFLDIELVTNKTGIDFGELLSHSSEYQQTPIIYLSVRTDLALEALNTVHCFGFLPKPYSREKLFQLLDDLFHQEQEVIEESVIVKDKNGVAFRVLSSDIVYVEAENRRIHIYTVLTEHTTQYMSIKTFWQLFPQLVQIHKKYLVNPSYIKHYDKTTQMLKIGEYELPVGRKYRNVI